MSINEVKKACFKVFSQWFINYRNNKDFTKHNKDVVNDIFIAKVLLKKFKAFNINIVLPDELLLLLFICTEDNPGQSQLILKVLLEDIKNKIKTIPDNYIITPEDFSHCFNSFPIMQDKEINDKYHKLWNKQKIKRNNPFESDNLCDTPEWWYEAIK